MKNFIDGLKPGDTVIVSKLNLSGVLKTVERITKTQVILSSGSRFRKKDGFEVGGDIWNTYHLEEVTPEKVSKIHYNKEREQLSLKLKCLNWHSLELSTLREVAEIINLSMK